MDEDIEELDRGVADEITRREKAIAPVFEPARELAESIEDDRRRARAFAVIDHARASARIEVRRTAWSLATESAEALGFHYVGQNTRLTWQSMRLHHRRHAGSGTLRIATRSARRRLRPSPVQPITAGGDQAELHAIVDSANEAIRAANEATRRAHRTIDVASLVLLWRDRLRSVRQLVTDAGAAVRFVVLQLVIFALINAALGTGVRLALSWLGWWGQVLATVATAAIFGIAIRPVLRRRFRASLRTAANVLFLRWVGLRVSVLIDEVAMLQRPS